MKPKTPAEAALAQDLRDLIARYPTMPPNYLTALAAMVDAEKQGIQPLTNEPMEAFDVLGGLFAAEAALAGMTPIDAARVLFQLMLIFAPQAQTSRFADAENCQCPACTADRAQTHLPFDKN